jgi:hypothetical protein
VSAVWTEVFMAPGLATLLIDDLDADGLVAVLSVLYKHADALLAQAAEDEKAAVSSALAYQQWTAEGGGRWHEVLVGFVRHDAEGVAMSVSSPAARLPDVQTLIRWSQSMAMLDAILSQEWEMRYF